MGSCDLSIHPSIYLSICHIRALKYSIMYYCIYTNCDSLHNCSANKQFKWKHCHGNQLQTSVYAGPVTGVKLITGSSSDWVGCPFGSYKLFHLTLRGGRKMWAFTGMPHSKMESGWDCVLRALITAREENLSLCRKSVFYPVSSTFHLFPAD